MEEAVGQGDGWFLLEPAPHAGLALPLALVGRVEPIASVLPVPGAPHGIVGLAEIRGRPTTLLDPALWIDGEGEDDPEADRSLPRGALLLAPPREHLALATDPDTRLRSLEPGRALPPHVRSIDASALDAVLSSLPGSRRTP